MVCLVLCRVALSHGLLIEVAEVAAGDDMYRYQHPLRFAYTVVPVMNGHPRDQAKVSVHCRWALIRGNLTLKCVGRGIDNMAVQGRWPLTTGVAQGRYCCTSALTAI